MSISLNKNKKTGDGVNIELKFEDEEILGYEDVNGNPVRRVLVNKDKFNKFEDEYSQSQYNKNNELNVEVRWYIKRRHIEEDKIEDMKYYNPMKIINDGINGVKKYLKIRVIEMIKFLEDSSFDVLDISITKLYIKKHKQQQHVSFKNIKMFGTLFDYKGFGLDVYDNKIPNSCVPLYLLELYNNENEKNPRKRLKKLTLNKILEELEMKSVDEGCCVNQISKFCEIHKITYYVLNFKYKLFETNNNMGYNSNLPRLVFMCANNHLYPIPDYDKRETIFKQSSNIGGQMKKVNKQIKNKEENENKEEEEKEQIHLLYEDSNIYGLLEYIKTLEIKKRRVIIFKNGTCDGFFHAELDQGRIHNGSVYIKDSKIISFKIDNITFDENKNYREIQQTIEILNKNIKKDTEKYIYKGQSIHSVAYSYYANNYDKNITSSLSPQLYDILISNVNSAFYEFYENKGDFAYDKNKQYTKILMGCDRFGWCVFTPTDEVEIYDGSYIQTGMYFIETDNWFPLKGNGWYFDDVIEKALKYNIITKENIKYQISPSYTLKQDHFKTFVDNVYKLFTTPKEAINGFIGMLGKSKKKSEKHYYESNYDVICNEFVNNYDNIKIESIRRNEKHENIVNVLNMNDGDFDNHIMDKLNEDTEINEPILYQMSVKSEIELYENTLPIHRKIYDKANMEMYETYLDIKKLNPNCEFIGIKTDCLVFNNIEVEPKISNKWGDIKKVNVPNIKDCIINIPPHIRTDKYTLTNQTWNIVKPLANTDDEWKQITLEDVEKYINLGVLTIGIAGTGKSYILNKTTTVLSKDEILRTYLTCAPTNKACKIIDGTTIHRLFDINYMDYSFSYNKILELKNFGLKYIFIDEISMINEKMWGVIAQIKRMFGFIFIGFGDFQQLPPVKEEHIIFKNAWIIKEIFNNTICELEKPQRFKDNRLLNDAYSLIDGDDIDFNKYDNTECDLSICWTNSCVNAINEKWNKYYSNDKTYIEVIGFGSTKFLLYEGLKIIAYVSYGKKYYNCEEFTVKSFDNKFMVLLHEGDNRKINVELKLDLKFTKHFKPTFALTVHKAQGSTIDRPFSIYEYDRMSNTMLYVSLSRSTQFEYVNLCDINILKPYKAYIYRYSINGMSYIGSTSDIKKRKEQHKTNTTRKFGDAIKNFGYDAFKFDILETIKYSEIQEVHEIENNYIIKYDSIKNGFNYRKNIKCDDECEYFDEHEFYDECDIE